MLAYKESEIGQILHEGINEAGSTASFTAVGTSYATHNEPMIPIYIFYSMFGFQRTGDGLWAAADQMARGFVLGATAGRTTLTGEGLQHADGHSLLLASTNPAAVTYDPAFAYEIAYIIESGLSRMFGEQPENVFFYITIYNEPYVQPAEPENFDPEGLLRGIYRYRAAKEKRTSVAQILASGVAMPEALRAADMLAADWDVAADVWSVTSWGELNRDGVACDKAQLRHPDQPAAVPYVTKVLGDTAGPGRGRVGLDACGTRADPAVGAQHLRHAGYRRLRLLRHPPGRAPLLQHRRRVGRRGGARGAGARRRDRPLGGRRGGQAVPDRRRHGGAGVIRGHGQRLTPRRLEESTRIMA